MLNKQFLLIHIERDMVLVLNKQDSKSNRVPIKFETGNDSVMDCF